jgi:UDP-N-acetylglucosamine--N-acetylmuramyl-(pentapeptide) pyrophosphoryl-undecaprenol N-acetylglucosamine transferase
VRIVIAGGGTGGHLFPGIAVAEEWIRRSSQNRVLFVGTQRGIEHRVLGNLSYDLKEIDVEGLKGRGVQALMKGLYRVPKSMLQSRSILASFDPDVVLGVGGYASGPAVLVAWMMGIPTAIAEQNAVAGNTNRILGKFVNRIFLTYEQSRTPFTSAKVEVTGNPVRAAFVSGLERTTQKMAGKRILVFGGSQGAAAINSAMVEMLPWLAKRKDNIFVVHQTGTQDLEVTKQAYQRHRVSADIRPFIENMASAYADSDLILCRAGATSLAEITAAGKASILIPYPFAANDHQTLNARAMVEAGAAVMIPQRDLTAEKLFSVIDDLLEDDQKLREMALKAKKLGRPDAAAQMVDACLQLAKTKRK